MKIALRRHAGAVIAVIAAVSGASAAIADEEDSAEDV